MTPVAALSSDNVANQRHRRAVGDKVESRARIVRAEIKFSQVARSINTDRVRGCAVEARRRMRGESVPIPIPDSSESTVRLGSGLSHGPGHGAGRAAGNVIDILLLAFWDVRGDEIETTAPGVATPVRSSGAPCGS